MNDSFKKNKSLMEDYMNLITINCESTIVVQQKLNAKNISISKLNNHNEVIRYNFNLPQLKLFAQQYNLKISGNKTQLINRIYSFLYFSKYIIKIQKTFRGIIARKYKSLHGPAILNRKLCTNADDFITMEPIEEIKFHQFYSYKDEDGFIYGFDINSLHNLFLNSKNSEIIFNPYNRNIIPKIIVNTIKHIVRLSRILKIHINLQFEDDSLNVSNEKALELRALSLFQNIDALGNYSDSQWFLSLDRNKLIKFIRELCDIWNYRAQITYEAKCNICPPNGNPFGNLSMPYIQTELNMINVKKVILKVLEKIVNSGVDKDSKTLGAYYILGSLTLVNENAATSLPWLFQSFC